MESKLEKICYELRPFLGFIAFSSLFSCVLTFPLAFFDGVLGIFFVFLLAGIVSFAAFLCGGEYKKELERQAAEEQSPLGAAVAEYRRDFYIRNLVFCQMVARSIGDAPPGKSTPGSYDIAFFQSMRAVLDDADRYDGRPPLGKGLRPELSFDETARIADEISSCGENDPNLPSLYAQLYQSVTGKFPDWWLEQNSV